MKERKVKEKKKILFYKLFLAVFILGLLCHANSRTLAKEDEQQLPVQVAGDKIEYLKESHLIKGTGNIVVHYKEIKITCDEVSIHTDTQDIFAHGNTKLFKDGTIETGDNLHYNYGTHTGTYLVPRGFTDPWFTGGDTVEKCEDNSYKITNGYITTDEYPDPIYRLCATTILIYPKEKIILKNMTIRYKNFPVFWFPYYRKSLDDKESIFTMVPGFNNRFGGFLLTSWSLFETPTIKIKAHSDYRFKRGPAGGLDLKYAFEKHEIDGLIQTYMAFDKKYEPYQTEGETREKTRYFIHADQRWEMTKNITSRLQCNYLSDPDFLDDFFRDENESEMQKETYIDAAYHTENIEVGLLFSKRLNSFYNTLERLPEFRIELPKRRIAIIPIADNQLPVFYKSTSKISNFKFRFKDDSEELDYDSVRAYTFHELSMPKKYFGWLNFEPFTGIREVYYSKTLSAGDDTFRHIFNCGFKTSTKISRVYDVYDKEWEIDLLRHVIEPYVEYNYIPEPNIDREELYHFDSVDKLDKRNDFKLGVRNKLQTKRNKSTWDIVNLNTWIYYYVNSKEIDGEQDTIEKHHFSNIYFDCALFPLSSLSLNIEGAYDQYDHHLDKVYTDITYRQLDEWSISLGHRYNRDQNDQIAIETAYRIHPEWLLRNYIRYDIKDHQLSQHEYVIEKDLRCWTLSFHYRKDEPRDENAFFITFKLKAIPGPSIQIG